MIRASRFDAALFEEAEANPALGNQARNLVLLVAALSGLGAALLNLDRGVPAAITSFLFRSVAVTVGWILWSAVTLWIGTTLTASSETHADAKEVRRVLAYAFSPWALSVLVFIPTIGPIIFLISSFWVLIAGVVAIHTALDFSFSRAVITVFAGWMVLGAFVIVATLLGLGLSLLFSGGS
ncbi:MAG: hypothetical protein HKN21_16000 [Candidatus Eisenbacteria bacterium]|uniref:Yip1 domain-containing protein n=1 Tax=Eiseniibacteriota bacterium TaxID=2212470 RepID=A0A7Y2EE08_UNCEI|nr:hypothetical protein [Candidatus Eisenbacteria bacterium]